MEEPLVHDWNPSSGSLPEVEILDETLRDGLQSPSVRNPLLDEKVELLSLMDELGVDAAKIGMPASSPRALEDCVALARYRAGAGLGLELACVARALPEDVREVARVSQRSGSGIEAYVFIAVSAIRARAESWDGEDVRRLLIAALDEGRREGLRLAFVAEDATRASPEALARSIATAIDHGASRICLCDTAGHAVPAGAARLVAFARQQIDLSGARVALDWHGHEDRGLGLANALAAAAAGATRIHATALGVGERAGNVALELLGVNLALEGAAPRFRPDRLVRYCDAAARSLGWTVPRNHPVLGADAFRTATGTHAATIAKAEELGDTWLVDRVFSSVPASWVGRRQRVEIGALSGQRAVTHWLARHGVDATPDLVQAILAEARRADRVLSEAELWATIQAHRGAESPDAADLRR